MAKKEVSQEEQERRNRFVGFMNDRYGGRENDEPRWAWGTSTKDRLSKLDRKTGEYTPENRNFEKYQKEFDEYEAERRRQEENERKQEEQPVVETPVEPTPAAPEVSKPSPTIEPEIKEPDVAEPEVKEPETVLFTQERLTDMIKAELGVEVPAKEATTYFAISQEDYDNVRAFIAAERKAAAAQTPEQLEQYEAEAASLWESLEQRINESSPNFLSQKEAEKDLAAAQEAAKKEAAAWAAVKESTMEVVKDLNQAQKDLQRDAKAYQAEYNKVAKTFQTAKDNLDALQQKTAEEYAKALAALKIEQLDKSITQAEYEERAKAIGQEFEDQITNAKKSITNAQSEFEKADNELNAKKQAVEEAAQKYKAAMAILALTKDAEKARLNAATMYARQERGEALRNRLKEVGEDFSRQAEKVRDKASEVRRLPQTIGERIKNTIGNIKYELTLSKNERALRKDIQQSRDELIKAQKEVNAISKKACDEIKHANRFEKLTHRVEEKIRDNVINKHAKSLEQGKIDSLKQKKAELDKKFAEQKATLKDQLKHKEISKKDYEAQLKTIESHYAKDNRTIGDSMQRARLEITEAMQKWKQSPKFEEAYKKELAESKNILVSMKQGHIAKYQQHLQNIERLSENVNQKRDDLRIQLAQSEIRQVAREGFDKDLQQFAIQYDERLNEAINRTVQGPSGREDTQFVEAAFDAGYRYNDMNMDHRMMYEQQGVQLLGNGKQADWQKFVESHMPEGANRSPEVEKVAHILYTVDQMQGMENLSLEDRNGVIMNIADDLLHSGQSEQFDKAVMDGLNKFMEDKDTLSDIKQQMDLTQERESQEEERER